MTSDTKSGLLTPFIMVWCVAPQSLSQGQNCRWRRTLLYGAIRGYDTRIWYDTKSGKENPFIIYECVGCVATRNYRCCRISIKRRTIPPYKEG